MAPNRGQQGDPCGLCHLSSPVLLLLRIITAMVRDNKPYDNAQYVAALQAKRVQWAMTLGAVAA